MTVSSNEIILRQVRCHGILSRSYLSENKLYSNSSSDNHYDYFDKNTHEIYFNSLVKLNERMVELFVLDPANGILPLMIERTDRVKDNLLPLISQAQPPKAQIQEILEQRLFGSIVFVLDINNKHIQEGLNGTFSSKNTIKYGSGEICLNMPKAPFESIMFILVPERIYLLAQQVFGNQVPIIKLDVTCRDVQVKSHNNGDKYSLSFWQEDPNFPFRDPEKARDLSLENKAIGWLKIKTPDYIQAIESIAKSHFVSGKESPLLIHALRLETQDESTYLDKKDVQALFPNLFTEHSRCPSLLKTACLGAMIIVLSGYWTLV